GAMVRSRIARGPRSGIDWRRLIRDETGRDSRRVDRGLPSMGLRDWFLRRKPSRRQPETSHGRASAPADRGDSRPNPAAASPQPENPGTRRRSRPPRPENVRPLEGTPMVAFEQGGTLVLLD